MLPPPMVITLSLSLGIQVYPSGASPAAGSPSQSSRVATARKRPPVAAIGTAPPKKVSDVRFRGSQNYFSQDGNYSYSAVLQSCTKALHQTV